MAALTAAWKKKISQIISISINRLGMTHLVLKEGCASFYLSSLFKITLCSISG